MNVLIILENHNLKKWHLNCLEILKENKYKFFFYNFRVKKKIKFNNFLYYLFKFINNPETEINEYHKIKNNYKVYHDKIEKNFKNQFKLNSKFNKFCKQKNIKLIIRFGLGIIVTNSKIPIISFHHGDPAKFRGRPSGFYEIANKEKVQGQVVQVLNTRLDDGKILSYGESKVILESYKKTLYNSYSISHLLLKKALISFKQNKFLKKKGLGKIYTTPTNFRFSCFFFFYILQKIKIIFRKIFFHKKWNIKKIKIKKINNFKDIKNAICKSQTSEKKFDANFIADPFFFKNKVICEYTKKYSQKGNLAIIDDKKIRIIGDKNNHTSFPSSFYLKEKKLDLILPETASWKEPTLFKLSRNNLSTYKKLKLDKKRFLLDPVIFRKKGYFYLFANDRELPNILSLWVSSSLNEKFKLHKSSPIRISPAGSRMGGNIIKIKNSLFRLSQNNSSEYGNGLYIFKIVKLSKNQYKEVFVDYMNFKNKFGPHTLSINHKKKIIVTDFYTEKFSFMSTFIKVNPFW